MINFFVPRTASVLAQFVKMKVKLEKVIAYHQNVADVSFQAHARALDEVNAAHKAQDAFKAFI